MSDESRSFISFTPVVDISFLDPILVAFLTAGESITPRYLSWNTSQTLWGYPEAVCRELNNALRLKGMAPNTNCILKMY